MISRHLEMRKDTSKTAVWSEAVGTLGPDEVENLAAVFRTRSDVTVARVESFTASPLYSPMNPTTFSAAGERARVMMHTGERHISVNLVWESPVLKHVSAPTAYGLPSGQSLCVLLPGPADPDEIRMLVLRCVNPDAQEAHEVSTLRNRAVPAADSPPAEIKTRKRGRLLDRNGVVLAENAGAGVRRYPFGALAAHTLGSTGDDRKVGQLEGRYGVELRYDAQLRKGEDVRLTLDARLQCEVQKVLREAGIGRGAVVILDPATGDLLATASMPNFDGNAFTPSISVEQWETLVNNPAAPLMDRTLQSYPPGSTFKLVVALAAGRAGKMDRIFHCKGPVIYDGKAFKCWLTGREGHGELNVGEAIINSCNCYFYQLGNEIGIDALAETARLLGLGARSGIGLAGESGGSVMSPASLKKVEPTAVWSSGYTANAAIGQGYTETTPLQMASVAATIANGGRVLVPRLVADGLPQLRHDFAAVDCKPEQLALLRTVMRNVVVDRKGTGKSARSELIAIAGKTGTSQSWREEGGAKVKDNQAWFVGHAPADMPRFAFAVLVEGGTVGGATAAPIARRIIEAVATGLPPPEPQPQDAGHLLPIDRITFGRK